MEKLRLERQAGAGHMHPVSQARVRRMSQARGILMVSNLNSAI